MNSNLTIEPQNAMSLLEYLKILELFLKDEENTEIVINRPQEVIVETSSGWVYHSIATLDYDYCLNLAKLIASYSKQKLNEENPIISATLPHGERVQIVMPPASRNGHISITIRKHSDKEFSLDDYEKQGFFEECTVIEEGLTSTDRTLLSLKEQGKIREFLELAVETKKNIIVSGSTGSGKTTFLKSLLKSVPDEERLISIETVDELRLYKSHKNTVSLFYSAGGKGISSITQKELLESSLRMKPDRIFLAELIRGEEAFYFLRNINSGHPGSMTTMHAGSARLAIEQLVLFLKEAGSGLSREEAKDLILMCVDIIIQLKNINGKRVITEIYYDPEHKIEKMA